MEGFISIEKFATCQGVSMTTVEQAIAAGLLPEPHRNERGRRGWKAVEIAGATIALGQMPPHTIIREILA
jgi:hypothetical protein